jgi:hypothetical protein
MTGSVDSTSFILSYPKLQVEDVMKLGLSKKRDKFGSWAWFDNGIREVHEPQITFYRTFGKIFRLRVDANIGTIYHGSNIHLPRFDEINNGLLLISNNIKERTGLEYDAFKADICRVHYAFDHNYNDNVKRVIDHYANYSVPRLKRRVIEDETVYFQNQSRGIRIYDKNVQVIKKTSRPELFEASRGLVRFEYFINELTPVKRFAKRMNFGGSSVRIMLSKNNINAAIAELQELVGFHNLNFARETKTRIIFKKTGDINKTRDLSGFLNIIEEFGKEFYRNPEYKTSKSTYYRKLRDLQKLGICI